MVAKHRSARWPELSSICVHRVANPVSHPTAPPVAHLATEQLAYNTTRARSYPFLTRCIKIVFPFRGAKTDAISKANRRMACFPVLLDTEQDMAAFCLHRMQQPILLLASRPLVRKNSAFTK